MPATLKVFPRLRLLNPSLPLPHFPAMKPDPSVKLSRVVPSFSFVFPHKLKYQGFRFPLLPSLKQPISTARGLSTRSSRESSGSGVDAGVRTSRSLIDDEADLSDWVSGLSSNSFKKTQLFSDSDNEKGGSSRDRGSSRFRGREEGIGNRKIGRDFDDKYGGGSRNNGFRRDSGSSKLRGREERGGGKRRREDNFNDFAQSRRRGEDRDVLESFPKRKGRISGSWGSSGDEGAMTRRRDSGNGGNSFGRQKGPVSSERFSRSPRSNEKFSKGFKDRNRNEGRIENSKSFNIGRGRDIGEKRVRPGTHVVSDEEDDIDEDDEDEDDEDDEVLVAKEEEKGYRSFKELINSEDDSEEVDEDEDDLEIGNSSFEREAVLTQTRGKDTPPSISPERKDSYLSETRFEDCPISPLSLKALKAAGYERMTVVQEATLPVILKGKDVLAKAKTGTGKTVAFLLPSIETVLKAPPIMRDQKRPPILVLVICPTRELASQASNEANTLLKYHPSLGVQVVIGGTRLALEQKRMQANPCQILVATPGRLRDHIENTAGFATRLMGVKVLVLDEADHLLDMGFRRDIENIIAAVPKQRQTLLFSATIPQEVRQISLIALKRDHEYINTVQEGSEETHSQVRQMHLVAPLERQFSILYALMKEHIADDIDYKVLVFCTTAMVTRLVADLLGELNLNVREIHSRKPQSYRTRVSEEFRKSKGLILVTSDVSARGVDYPDVTLVVQIGLPADRQQYIHRLGRTGRKGKEGQGILMLAPWEEFFLSTLKDLPITKAEVPLIDPDMKKKVERALSHVEMKNKEAAYQAWLGYYNSNKTVGKDKYKLVELANEFSRSMGLDNPPAIPKLVLGKMGLRNIPGLRSK